MHDLQRDLAKTMYGLINPGTATTFALAWPAVRNYQTYRYLGSSVWTHYGVWLDDTKAPFTSLTTGKLAGHDSGPRALLLKSVRVAQQPHLCHGEPVEPSAKSHGSSQPVNPP